MAARLVVTRGPRAGAEIVLGERRVTIGRDRGCDVVCDDASVATIHAEVHWEGESYRIADVGSLSGTYRNGGRIARAVLVDGDEIWVGKARFRFHAPVR